MRLRPAPTLLALLALGIVPASAGGIYGPYGAYGTPGYEGRAYGFAGPAIRGEYIGAPFTRVPRPTEIVPTPWTYGTYGVPTYSGIAPAPVGQPTLYVIDSPEPRRTLRRPARGEAAMPGTSPSARVVTVSVPRR